jgi:hypothetical protein
MTSLPYFAGAVTDRQTHDMGIALGSSIVSFDKKDTTTANYVTGRSYNPNQVVVVGLKVPPAFFEASVAGQYTLEKHPVKTILDGVNAVVNVQLASGNTPLHVAATNSRVATELFVNDGRLDVNGHNNDGETPLYLAYAL